MKLNVENAQIVNLSGAWHQISDTASEQGRDYPGALRPVLSSVVIHDDVAHVKANHYLRLGAGKALSFGILMDGDILKPRMYYHVCGSAWARSSEIGVWPFVGRLDNSIPVSTTVFDNVGVANACTHFWILPHIGQSPRSSCHVDQVFCFEREEASGYDDEVPLVFGVIAHANAQKNSWIGANMSIRRYEKTRSEFDPYRI